MEKKRKIPPGNFSLMVPITYSIDSYLASSKYVRIFTVPLILEVLAARLLRLLL